MKVTDFLKIKRQQSRKFITTVAVTIGFVVYVNYFANVQCLFSFQLYVAHFDANLGSIILIGYYPFIL